MHSVVSDHWPITDWQSATNKLHELSKLNKKKYQKKFFLRFLSYQLKKNIKIWSANEIPTINQWFNDYFKNLWQLQKMHIFTPRNLVFHPMGLQPLGWNPKFLGVKIHISLINHFWKFYIFTEFRWSFHFTMENNADTDPSKIVPTAHTMTRKIHFQWRPVNSPDYFVRKISRNFLINKS